MHYTPQEEDRIRAEIDAAKAERLSASAPSETACQPRSLALATGSALDAMRAERDDWRTKHWNAHHHSQEMFMETLRLRRALEQIHTRLGQHYGIDANGVEVECYEIANAALSPNSRGQTTQPPTPENK